MNESKVINVPTFNNDMVVKYNGEIPIEEDLCIVILFIIASKLWFIKTINRIHLI